MGAGLSLVVWDLALGDSEQGKPWLGVRVREERGSEYELGIMGERKRNLAISLVPRLTDANETNTASETLC